MAESGGEESAISAENVFSWTKDLSSLILVQRARVMTLKSPAEIEEAELKLESMESLLREAIIAHLAEVKKQEEDGAARSLHSPPAQTITDQEETTPRQKLEQLKSRLREAIIDQGARVRKLDGNPKKEEAVERLEALKADFKAATGGDWSDVRAEGPILLITNRVRGSEILPEFRERLRELTRNGIIR